MRRSTGDSERHPGLLAAMLILVAGSGALSWLTGKPGRLPGAALGSELVLFLEKAALIFALLLLLFVLLLQAYHGRLPMEMRGYKFGSLREAKEENDVSVTELRGAVQLLESHDSTQDRRLDSVERTQRFMLEELADRR